MSEIKITYETLFDLLRREKSQDELQKLDPEFYKDVLAYLQEKQAILQDTSGQAELFASSEKEKIRIQFQNIKKILREFYERRERKVLHMALIHSRTQSNLTDMGALLDTEKQLFYELNKLLTQYKDATLTQLLHLNLPESHVVVRNPFIEASPSEIVENAPETTMPLQESPALGIAKTHLALRFKASVPKFLGTELEIYGPYEPDQTAELPAEIAQVLIQKGRAEEIQ